MLIPRVQEYGSSKVQKVSEEISSKMVCLYVLIGRGDKQVHNGVMKAVYCYTNYEGLALDSTLSSM